MLDSEVFVRIERETLRGGVDERQNRFGMLEGALGSGVRQGGVSRRIGDQFADPVVLIGG